MTAPRYPYPKRPADERLAELIAAERVVELRTLDGGAAVQTAFGYGPEFWLVSAGQDPNTADIDFRNGLVVDALLIIEGGQAVPDQNRVAARGLRITRRVPRL